ncbi:Phage integrase family protein [compost metagenome]
MQKNNKEHDFLFIKSDGEPAEVGTVRSWSTKWEKFLETPFYFHSLRHYLVTNLTRIGLESDFIIELMGWTSADMYRIYNDLTAKDRKWKSLGKLKSHISKDDKGEVEYES